MIYVIFENLDLASIAAPIMGDNIANAQPGTTRWDLNYVIFSDDTVAITTWCMDDQQLADCMAGVSDWQIYTGDFDNEVIRYQAIPYTVTQDL